MISPRHYWWAWDVNTRTIAGPKNSEEEINALAFSVLDADFRVFSLPTKDRKEAVRQIKYKLMEETKSLQSSMQKFRHYRGNNG